MKQLIVPLKKLQRLRNFKGGKQQFWDLFLDLTAVIAGADSGVIAMRDSSGEWRTVSYFPKGAGTGGYIKIFLDHMDELNDTAKKKSRAVLQKQDYTLIAIPVMIDAQGTECLTVFYLKKVHDTEADTRLSALSTLRDVSAHYQVRSAVDDSIEYKKRISEILEFLVALKEKKKFLSAAMTFCNEIASRFKCSRVSLGWKKKGYIRVIAMSHTDDFEKKMEVVKTLEVTMEEAFDQDRDINYPGSSSDDAVVKREHEQYAKAQDVSNLCSVLLRQDEETCGVCTLEREGEPFGNEELKFLRIMTDQAVQTLAHLKYYDRWFGAIIADKTRDFIGKILGFEHTWTKLLVLTAVIAAAFTFFFPLPYRIDCKAILRTDKIHYVTAPFQGYIDSVGVEVGDVVEKGSELLRMDREELLLKEADLLAKKRKYARSMQKARAAEELADLRIARANYDETQARLDINRFKLEQSVIRSEYDEAAVIEGELRKKEGMPVEQGQQLFKLARIEDIYGEMEVDEMEVHNVDTSLSGEIALKSRPEKKFPVDVELVYPAAEVKKENNVFLVRTSFMDEKPEWFRPGMTGVGKIDAGKKTLWWILSHRTIDFLRMRLWW